MEHSDRYLTTRELAEYLRLRPSTVRRWARSGALPCVHLSRRVVRFDLATVLAAIAAARPNSTAAPTKGAGHE